MNTELNNGQLTVNFQQAHIAQNDTVSPHKHGLRIQFYWPKFKWKNTKRDEKYDWSRNTKEISIRFDTCLRIIVQDDYIGFGSQLLGFGAAFDYQMKEKTK